MTGATTVPMAMRTTVVITMVVMMLVTPSQWKSKPSGPRRPTIATTTTETMIGTDSQ
jgi:hypothetical protein